MFESPLFLSGTIISPFPQQTRPKANPFFRKEEPRAPSKRKPASTQTKARQALSDSDESLSDTNSPPPPLSNIELPFIAGAVTVLSLGTINDGEKYSTPSLLFPVGYRSRRSYWSIYALKSFCFPCLTHSEKCDYISEIVDGGKAGPIFRVFPEADPSDTMESPSSSGAWKQVLLRVRELRESRGESPSGTAVSGCVVSVG